MNPGALPFSKVHYVRLLRPAPSIANLFMRSLEHRILNSTQNKPLHGSWKRYVDDVHFLWTDGADSLEQFKTYLSNFHPTIKFTFEVSSTQIPYLDTLTQLKNIHTETTLYSKPTDKHTYLLPFSCHPSHTFHRIPYSQALRIRQICSTPEKEEHHLNTLKTNLVKRQYDKASVNKEITRVKL